MMPLLLILSLLFAAATLPVRPAFAAPTPFASTGNCAGIEALHQAARPGKHSGSLMVGKLKRHYLVYVPEDKSCGATTHPRGSKRPVVIVLHGALCNPWTVSFASGMTEKASEKGFLVVYPYGTGIGSKQILFWNAGACCALASKNKVDDVAFIRDLISVLQRDYDADPQRIYVAGVSNGGMMAYRLAAELSGSIAAIGSVEGCMFKTPPPPPEPVSVIAIHGTADSVIPYAGGTGLFWGHKVRNVTAAATTIAYWVHHDQCGSIPKTEKSEGITSETYSGGRDGSSVRLITIEGGRHAWPGSFYAGIESRASGRLKATEEMLAFFLQHPKQRTPLKACR